MFKNLRVGCLLVAFAVLLILSGICIAQDERYQDKIDKLNLEKPPCAANIDACPDEGCSVNNSHDPKLNKVKNLAAEPSGTPEDVTLSWIKKRRNPATFHAKQDRAVLENLGEGKYVRTVGYLLAVKLELGGESCNCRLHTERETDNHLVLVTRNKVNKTKLPANASKKQLTAAFKRREPESITAEFTPRVRTNHPNFTNLYLEPLVNRTPQGALWVRVTGLLMFDSEHFIHNPLKRVNNWEIHPVYKLEYCPVGKVCTATGVVNWVDIDQ